MKIVHIADVHVRSSKKLDVHRIQFNKFYTMLDKIKPDRIVIVGDLIDVYNPSHESELLVGEFLNTLSKISKVVLCKGNHEVNLGSLERVSSIQKVVDLLDNDNILFLDRTGFYEDDDVIWVNYNYVQRDVNPWDNENISIPSNVKEKITIGLYHDPIYGSSSDIGATFISEKHKHISYFYDNDFGMFGDIHKHAYLNRLKSRAYSGSFLQKDFGESCEKGFMLWDISTPEIFTSELITIPNDYTFITFMVGKNFDYDNINLESPFITEHSEVRVNWCDENPLMNNENEQKLKSYIKEKFNVNKVKFEKDFLKHSMVETNMINESVDVSDPIEQRIIFTEYLKLNKYADEFIKELLEVDDIVNSHVVFNPNMGVEFSIDSIDIDNFKSYDKASIDFKKMGFNKLIQSSGMNGSGKSTILDAICYLLYGKTLGTIKKEKYNDARFINNKRELDYCKVSGVISINGEEFYLERTTTRKWNKDRSELTASPTTIQYAKGTSLEGSENLNEEVKVSTQKLIETSLGDFDSFINKSFINSDNLNSLLSIDRSVFVDGLITDIGMEIFEQKLEQFKLYKKEILSKRNNINIEAVKADVDELRKEKELIKSELEDIDVEIISSEKDKKIKILEKESEISKLEKIDPKVENLIISDIEISIKTEEDNIIKNKERLVRIERLKSEVLVYDSSKVDNKQNEIDKTANDISDIKLSLSKIDNDILIKENDIKDRKNNISKIVNDYSNKLLSDNKDYNLDISVIKDKFSTHLNEYISKINVDLGIINNDYSTINNNIETYVTESKRLEEENKTMENSTVCVTCNRPLDGDMSHVQHKIDDNISNINLLIEKISKLKPKLDKLKSESDKTTAKLSSIKLKDYSFDTELQQLFDTCKTSILNNKSKIDENIILIENLSKELPSAIKNQVDVIETDIVKLQNDITDIRKSETIIRTKLSDNENIKHILSEELITFKEERDNIDKKKEKISYQPKIESNIEKSELNIKEHNKSISDYNLTKDKIKYNKTINENVFNLNKELDLIDEDLIIKNNIKSGKNTSLALINSKLSKYKDDIIEHNRQVKENELLSVYLKCISREGLPLYMIKKVTHLINNEMGRLLTDVNFECYFDDNLDLKVLHHDSRTGQVQQAIVSSGMERSMIVLALKIALRMVNKKAKPSILLLDEVMGKLDMNHTQTFMSIVENIKSQVDKVILIEHNHMIQYDYLLHSERDENGISTLRLS